MTLKECYEDFGGDYESVKVRISNEEIIKKFVIRFLTEPSYDNLCQALEDEAYEDAFRAAHSIKGICANLGFPKLGSSSSLLTEFLRGKDKEQIDQVQCKMLFESMSEDYRTVIESIKRLEESDGRMKGCF